MRKRYGLVMINQMTGEVVITLSNDSPITKAQFPSREHRAPSVPPVIYRYRRFEYESEKQVRARAFHNDMTVAGATLADRQNPNAALNFPGLPEVNNFIDKGNAQR